MIQKDLLYSLIISHFESPIELKTLLLSVPCDPRIEIIVVDDRSQKFLSEYHDLQQQLNHPNLKFYINESHHKGAGACRNMGLKMAKGEWILFADDDDVFLPHAWSLIFEYGQREESMLIFKPQSVDRYHSTPIQRHLKDAKRVDDYLNDPSVKNKVILLYRFAEVWSKMYKRSFIERHHIQFDEIMVANDLNFSAHCAAYCDSFYVTQASIYQINYSPDSVTERTQSDFIFDRVDSFIRYHDFINSVLPKDQVKWLKLNGFRFLKIALQNHYSLSKILKILSLLLSYKISIFDKEIV
jgi:glycosyltransferase involved in cell wall biosynthesis